MEYNLKIILFLFILLLYYYNNNSKLIEGPSYDETLEILYTKF